MVLDERYFFEESLALREKQTFTRMKIGFVIGLSYGFVIGWALAAAWYGLYVALQLINVAVVRRRLSLPVEKRGPLTVVACAMIMLSNIVFIGLALPAVFMFGPWGTFGYAFMTTGLTQNALSSARASMTMFFCIIATAGPAFIAMPFFVAYSGAPPAYILITTLSLAMGLVGFAQMWRNNTALYRSEVELRLRAERADEAKSRFIATVSHDLRTPLSAIQAGATRLAASPGADGEDAALIKDASVMMRSLLDDLLDMFKNEAGQMTIEAIALDPAAMLRSVARFWASEAQGRGLALVLEGEVDLPAWIEGDPTRLRQILNNLISNAMKFTKAGEVRLKVSTGAEQFRIAVVDSGEGIDVETLNRLFTPYVQASSETARKHGGTGLGLAISRDLARLMGGELTVDSVKGQGSTFTLSLPLRVCAPPPISEAEPVQPQSPTERPLRVLIVDDHEINRRAMTAILRAIDAVVAVAASGQSALDQLALASVDLVLMDVHMPDLDGWETTRRLRSTAGPNRTTPVIAVTGATSDQDLAACLDAGINTSVAKPVDPTELFDAIRRAMSAEEANFPAVPDLGAAA